jgi:hypothetical protein
MKTKNPQTSEPQEVKVTPSTASTCNSPALLCPSGSALLGAYQEIVETITTHISSRAYRRPQQIIAIYAVELEARATVTGCKSGEFNSFRDMKSQDPVNLEAARICGANRNLLGGSGIKARPGFDSEFVS